MANLEFCCNPFKRRNHNPESWRLLPVTKSLREQFQLYLDNDTDICISCKRKLYCTLPTASNEESSGEIEESAYWSNNEKIETRELNKVCDYFTVRDHRFTDNSANERQADIRTDVEQVEDISEDNEDVSETEESSGTEMHLTNSQNTTQVIESIEHYTSWYNST